MKENPSQLQVEVSGSLSIAASSRESRPETDPLEYKHVYVNGVVAFVTETQAAGVTECNDKMELELELFYNDSGACDPRRTNQEPKP
jgi:hypothetical protein